MAYIDVVYAVIDSSCDSPPHWVSKMSAHSNLKRKKKSAVFVSIQNFCPIVP